MFRLVGNMVSPAGERASLTILIYHRVLPERDAILHDEIDAATFEQHARLLASAFNVLTLGEACAGLQHGRLPSRAACITFDDGYADNETVALPILQRFGLRATFFIAPGYSGGGVMFNDAIIETLRAAPEGIHDLTDAGFRPIALGDPASRRAEIDKLIAALKYRTLRDRQAAVEAISAALETPAPRHLMMNPSQVRHLHHAGMEIGAHTVNHPILAAIPDEDANMEIAQSKRLLEEMIDASVQVFAYPNGRPGRDYAGQHVRFVRDAGFKAAVSTIPGVARRGADLYQLPRFGPWDRSRYRLGVRLLMNCARDGGHRTATAHE